MLLGICSSEELLRGNALDCLLEDMCLAAGTVANMVVG